ncbi:MAG: methionyl-tRNA formyltransferase [Pseudolabrys sp.]
MRVALFGMTDLTRTMLDVLREIGCEICAIVTGPEKFAISYEKNGVDNKRYEDLSSVAVKLKIPSFTYLGNRAAMESFLEEQKPDFGLVAGWYHLVMPSTRALFPAGCAGLHASLLPKLRGGAPLNWAMLSGERETAVTLFLFDDGVDSGPIFGQQRFPIHPTDYIADVVERSRQASRALIREAMPKIMSGTLKPVPQTGAATYGLQRRPSDSAIDWTQSAEQIELIVRASSRPYAGAYSNLDDDHVTIWRAKALASAPVILGAPGQVAIIPEIPQPVVVCGGGVLALEEVADAEGNDLTAKALRWNHRRFATAS